MSQLIPIATQANLPTLVAVAGKRVPLGYREQPATACMADSNWHGL